MGDVLELEQKKNAKQMSVKEKNRRLRIWEPIRKWSSLNIEDNFTFKIISYNVMAVYSLETQQLLLRNCLPEDVQWDVRAKRLYKEIVTLDPDILCLQEVPGPHIRRFCSLFERIGFTGVYKKRTQTQNDGCVIYFKSSVFQMEDHILVELHHPTENLLYHDEVGLAVRLMPRDKRAPATPLIVATTRLFKYNGRDAIRLAQINLFLAHVERFASNGNQLGYHPIILCGDMSAPPGNHIIKFLAKGYISISKTPIKGDEIHVSQQKATESATAWDDHSTALPLVSELEHPLRFHSVYWHYKRYGHREATTFCRGRWVIYDYIFFSRDIRLKLLKRYRLLTEAECMRLQPRPNRKYGSNHFALGAIFALTAPTAN